MSLMSMRRKMASRQTVHIIMWVLVGVFVASIFFGAVVSTNMFRGAEGPGNRPYVTDQERLVLATVGTEVLHQGYVDDIFKEMVAQRSRDGGRGMNGPDDYLGARSTAYSEALKDLYVEIGLKRLGVRAGDGEITRIARDSVRGYYVDMVKQANEQAKSMADNAARVTKENEGKPEDKRAEVPPVKSADELLNQQMLGIVARYGRERIKGEDQKITKDQFVNWVAEDFFIKNQGSSFTRRARMMLLGEAVAKKVLAQRGKPETDPMSEPFIQKLRTKEVEASWLFIGARKPMPEQKPGDAFGAKAEADKSVTGLQAAATKAAELRDAIMKANTPEAFATEAGKSSHDDNTKSKGGGLGWLSYNGPQMYSFNEASVIAEYLAFTQTAGEISQPTLAVKNVMFSFSAPSTEVGYALVKVQNVRDRDFSQMPEDSRPNWERDKEKLIIETRQDYARRLGEVYIEKLKYEFQVAPQQPEAWMTLMRDEQPATAAAAKPFTDALAALGYTVTAEADEKGNLKNREAIDTAFRRAMYEKQNLTSEVRAALAYRMAQDEKDQELKVNYLEEALAAAGEQRSKLYAESAGALIALADTRTASTDKLRELERASDRLDMALTSSKQPLTIQQALRQAQISDPSELQRIMQEVEQSKTQAISERKDILAALRNLKKGFDAVPDAKSVAKDALEGNIAKVTQWLKDNPETPKPEAPAPPTPEPKPAKGKAAKSTRR